MLETFVSANSLRILIKAPVSFSDRSDLSLELSKKYKKYHLEFGKVYSVSQEIINILYTEIYTNKKSIAITTHTNSLNRYLNKLGFKAKFVSLVKDYVLSANKVEVVLIGGSSDSSPKIIEIVKNINLSNISLVLVQHVEMGKKGIFDEILQYYTKCEVRYAKDNEKLEKGFIYIAPDSKHLKIKDGYFHLSNEEKYNYSKPSISLSYESFSNYYREKLLVIQECGYASDGVDKMPLIKENTSKLILQDIKECEAKPMVQHALDLHQYDYIFNLKDIIRYINFINKIAAKELWIEYLLYTIYEKYSCDFRFYHRDTIRRRLEVFMIKHEIKNIKDAVGIILFNKVAFKGFFLEVSINVTELFRHPQSLNFMADFIKENLVNHHHIRIWSAGCSSGEEVYSLGILLDSLSVLDKSIIYATDFNNVILQEAKNAIYSLKSIVAARENLCNINLDINLDKYIDKKENYFIIDEKIKKKTHFFQHNLATDSSFNEFDIIICKNVVIYFDYNLQKKVFQLFYNSLKLGGYLVLGSSEALMKEFSSQFELYSSDSKIYKKVA